MTAAIYSIGAVARMLGVPTATLRTWEERYGVVMPDRSPGGHRLYTRDHVEQLRFVLRSIEGGMQPADAHRLLTDRLSNDPDRDIAVSGSETRLVIMLAERDPHAAELAEYFLRTEGYETFMALEAREAEARLRGAVASPRCGRPPDLRRCGAGSLPNLPGTGSARPRDLAAGITRRGVGIRGRRVPPEAPRSPATGVDRQGPARAERVPPNRGALAMSDRVSGGSQRLNDMLGGGLPGNGINLIIGLPGSGKTILAQQYAFHNATPERPAIYLSTVSEPLEKILRYGQTLSFFDQRAIGTAVFYEDLGGTVNDEGLPGVLERISELLKERRPGMIIIDSFKALHPYARRDEDFRRFLHELAGRLSAFPVTSFWVGEYGHDEIAGSAEFAVADSILSLSVERAGGRELRVFQVLKLRGSDFLSGKHAYRLSGDGVEFFPRLADPVDQTPYQLDDVKISSGIKILDEMLGQGLLARGLDPRGRPVGIGEDAHGPALHLRRGSAGRARCDRHAPGERRPTRADRQRIRLVSR